MTKARDTANLISTGVPNSLITLDAAEIPNISTDKLTSGTLPDARIAAMTSSKLTGALPAISGASLTALPATLPASSGVNLTALNATNLGSGTVPTARLGSGTASSSTFLRGDASYASAGESNAPVFHIEGASNTISNATSTKITFDNVIYDASTLWSTANNKLTLTSGKWFINFFCTHYGSLWGRGSNIYIYKNGSQHKMPFHDFHMEEECPNSHHSSLWGSCVVESGGSDYFEFYYYGLTNTGNHTVTYLKIQGFYLTS